MPTTNPAPPGAQHAPRGYRPILILLTAAAAALSPAACTVAHGATPAAVPTYSTASAAPVSPSPAATSDSAATYVSSFCAEFPQLAQGKTDAQIISDGQADCSEMAASWTITTPSMAQRYGLGDSTADQFTLHNIALLDMFTICPVR